METTRPITTGDRESARHHPARELLVKLLRWLVRRVHGLRTALGVVIIGAAGIIGAMLWLFALVAEEVREGDTQRFDEAALTYLDQFDHPVVEKSALEITALGNGTVVLFIAIIAGLFLWLTRHRYSAAMLFAATTGGMLINWALKNAFDRPRPTVVEWGQGAHVVSSSFPSGHATSAAVVYITVAYLAARLQKRHLSRVLTVLAAIVLAVLIAFSRLMLGVHYPSDIAAGMASGLAWAAFCMVMLEAAERFILRHDPKELDNEAPSAAAEEDLQTRPLDRRRRVPQPPAPPSATTPGGRPVEAR